MESFIPEPVHMYSIHVHVVHYTNLELYNVHVLIIMIVPLMVFNKP